MSTLKTTNISHPNSAANDIVLDANGNVNVDSGTVYVDATNNRVGIGTSSPSDVLHVEGVIRTSSSGSNAQFANNYLRSNQAGTFYFDQNSGGQDFAFRLSNVSNLDTTAMTIKPSGRVGIGTTSPGQSLDVNGNIRVGSNQRVMFGPAGFEAGIKYASSGNFQIAARAGEVITFNGGEDGTERARIDSSGRLLVGTTADIAPDGYASKIQTAGTSFEGGSLTIRRDQNNSSAPALLFTKSRSASVGGNTLVSNNDSLGIIAFYAADGSDVNSFGARIACDVDGTPGANDMPGRLVFSTTADGASSPTERMRISQNGTVTIGQASSGSTGENGSFFAASGQTYHGQTSSVVLLLNRRVDDGTVVSIRGQDVEEGTISVSGTTVSYNGAHLSRWSQLPSGAERIEILRGSVLSNIDEMCEWGDEENEQLNRMKVSDVEGDRNVSGVFQAWDDDDDTYVNDFYCAMTGDFIIRIAAGVTVERGDLLMSAGDGTAKPQDDDIIRSKTIAKVTSTNVSCTYDDGSYCVPCVLMAC